jgi:hypothetical protein
VSLTSTRPGATEPLGVEVVAVRLAEDQVAQVEPARLDGLALLWAQGKITSGEWDLARTVLLTEIDEADAAVAEFDDIELPDIADLHKEWRPAS